MSKPPPPAEVLCFGPFTMNLVRRELRRSGTPVEVGARAQDLLIHFLRHPGQVISGPDLIKSVWNGRMVEANNLTVQLSHLRRALGESAGEPYIRTMLGHGYMFTAEVAAQAYQPETAPRPEPVVAAGSAWADWYGPPEPSGRFIGRSVELADLAIRVGEHRLTTISGMGGVGKTRLALRAASMLGPMLARRVAIIDLAPLPDTSDINRVSDIVAAAMGGGGGAYAVRSAAILLRSKATLLVLDNAEHVADAVGDFVQAVLADVPDVVVIVTSRGTLGVPGESVLRLMPLAVPEPSNVISAAEALSFESVQIFVALASLLMPDFTFDDVVAPHVASICRRLDGIALAIHMAVPRLQVLSPRQLAERLQQHFGVLAPATRDALPRQRTLQTMFDWSWQLLLPLEQAILRRLAVFSGGAPLGMLAALAAREGHSEWDTLTALTRLVENSLVIPELADREPRYRLLQTTREFALAQSGEATPGLGHIPDLRRAHAEEVAALMERAEAEWPTLHGTTWLDRYGPETANLRSAVTWAFAEPGDPSLALRLVAFAYPLWWEQPGALLRDGKGWLKRAIERITRDTPPQIAARLWFGHSWRDARMSDIWNLDAAMVAVTLFQALGDTLGQGSALWRAGGAAMTPETIELSERLFAESESLLRAHPPTKWLALCLGKRADLLARRDDPVAALALNEEALEIVRNTGHDYGMMTVGSNMADVLFVLGQPERALKQLEQVVSALRPTISAPAVATQAAHLLLAGRVEAASLLARQAATQAAALGMTGALAWAAETAALIEAGRHQLESAARLAGYARRIHPATPFRYGARREVFHLLEQHLEAAPAGLARRREEGAAWTDEQAGVWIEAALAPPMVG